MVSSLAAPVRLQAVAKLLGGWSIWKAKRYIQEQERQSGTTLLIGDGRRPYMVHLAALLRVDPDLAETVQNLEGRIEELELARKELEVTVMNQAAQLGLLRARMAAAEKALSLSASRSERQRAKDPVRAA